MMQAELECACGQFSLTCVRPAMVEFHHARRSSRGNSGHEVSCHMPFVRRNFRIVKNAVLAHDGIPHANGGHF